VHVEWRCGFDPHTSAPGALVRRTGREKGWCSVEDVLLVLPDGTVVGVWSDDVPWQEIGVVTAVPRLSHVEFDVDRQEWVARDAATGEVVASGPNRAEVLALERAHYVEMLDRGEIPLKVFVPEKGG
jgi:hypothetical protein